MCQKHQALLVRQAGFRECDPWRSLVLMSQLALFQMASCDKEIHARIGGDINRFSELGCLACLKPDLFGEVVQASEAGEAISKIKALGLAYIERSRHG